MRGILAYETDPNEIRLKAAVAMLILILILVVTASMTRRGKPCEGCGK